MWLIPLVVISPCSGYFGFCSVAPVSPPALVLCGCGVVSSLAPSRTLVCCVGLCLLRAFCSSLFGLVFSPLFVASFALFRLAVLVFVRAALPTTTAVAAAAAPPAGGRVSCVSLCV